MRIIRGALPIALFLGLSAATSSAEQPKRESGSPAEPWQESWEKFVAAHNACVKDAGCNTKVFLDKEVRWAGVVRSIDLQTQPPSVVMDMPGTSLVDRNGVGLGKSGDLFVFVLNPVVPDIPGWKAVAKGQRVRFRAKTAGGITGSVVGFSAIPGHKMIMVNTEGGEFLERLPEEGK